MAQRFTGIAESAVPVLLPFDIGALSRDQAAGTVAEGDERYQSGFRAARFFEPGPAGYDAAFTIRTADVAELSDIKFAAPVRVLISGSAVLYELDAPNISEELPVAGLDDFPGIRRIILEHHLRYTFVRFGVPYAVSIGCFDTDSPRENLPTCKSADRIARRFLQALHVVGGMPRRWTAAPPLPVKRPRSASQSFGYYGPGQILSGTGVRAHGGRVDYTAYSQIRFPLADAPVYANSQVFQNRNRTRTSSLDETPSISYAWRDNFCERRGFPVAQCPAGAGHQGQDLQPAQCRPAPGTDRCEQYGDIVAVRGGVILRAPRQEAAYLFVNSANEHVRFRYLHMNPHKMDADQLLSGRRVQQGEVIGEVSNFSMKEAGTSYHLHFDMQVLTKDGWVFVNPYMTLVAGYERLIGARGAELSEPDLLNAVQPATDAPAVKPPRTEPKKTAGRAERNHHADERSTSRRSRADK